MKRILVGLDNSPRAQGVLAAAAHYASASPGCKLVLFHSVGLPTELPASGFVDGDLGDTLTTQARRDLDAAAAGLPAGLVERTEILVGVPWEAICREATKCDADLIVIGSHGYSGVDRLLGTTAAKVVNHTDRSVLVVRPPVAAKAT